jgi:putative ABC transport system permease protein
MENLSDESNDRRKMIATSPLSRLVCSVKILSQGIWINRFQLVLTTLTMSFGSLGLALTIFLGDGALHVLWADLEDLLGNWVVVYPTPGEDMQLLQKRLHPGFAERDLEVVRESNGGARLVSPAIFNQRNPVEYRGKGGEMFWDAITAELASEAIFRPVRGRGMSPEAFAGNAWECLVTEDVAEKLEINFDEEPSLLLGNHLFKVVGVTISPPRNEHFRQRIMVPYTLARILWMPPGDIGQIVVAWDSVDGMSRILDEVGRTLDEYRGRQTYYLSSTQFQIQSSRKIVKNFIVVGTTQSLFCIMIASIGVLNVMLTNVARRTREFAIRIAMGARHKDILMVVLTESLFIGLCGALTGLFLALATAPFIGNLMAAGIAEATHLSPQISLKGILLPLLICGACSLIAGVIPALKVRQMDILSALRNDT